MKKKKNENQKILREGAAHLIFVTVTVLSSLPPPPFIVVHIVPESSKP